MFSDIQEQLERVGSELMRDEVLSFERLLEAPVLRLNDELLKVPVTDVLSHDFSIELTLRALNALVETRWRKSTGELFQVRRFISAGEAGVLDDANVTHNGGVELLAPSSWSWIIDRLRHPERHVITTLPSTSDALGPQSSPSRAALRRDAVRMWFINAFVRTTERSPSMFSREQPRSKQDEDALYLGQAQSLDHHFRTLFSHWRTRLISLWPRHKAALHQFASRVGEHVRNIYDASAPHFYLGAHEQSHMLWLNSLLPRLLDWSALALGLPLADFLALSLRAGAGSLRHTSIRVEPDAAALRGDGPIEASGEPTYDSLTQVTLQDELTENRVNIVQFSQQPSSPQIQRISDSSVRTDLEYHIYTQPPRSRTQHLCLREALAGEIGHLVLKAPRRQEILERAGRAQAAREVLDDAWQDSQTRLAGRSIQAKALLFSEPVSVTLTSKSSEISRASINTPLWHQQTDLRRAAQISYEEERRYTNSIAQGRAKIDSVQHIYRHRSIWPAIGTALDNSKSFELNFQSVLLRYGQPGLKHFDYRFEQRWPRPSKVDLNHLIRNINRAFGLYDDDAVSPYISMFTARSGGPLLERSARFEGRLTKKRLLEGRAFALLCAEQTVPVRPKAFDLLGEHEVAEIYKLFKLGGRFEPEKELVSDVHATNVMFAQLAEYLDHQSFDEVLRITGALVQLALMGARHFEVAKIEHHKPSERSAGRAHSTERASSFPAYAAPKQKARPRRESDPLTEAEREHTRLHTAPLYRPGPAPIDAPTFTSDSGVYVAVLNRAWPLLNSYAQRGSISAREDAHDIVLRWTHAMPHIDVLTRLQRFCAADTHLHEGYRMFLLANIGKANIGMMRLLWPTCVLQVQPAVRPFHAAQTAELHSIVRRLTDYQARLPPMMTPLLFLCGGLEVARIKCDELQRQHGTWGYEQRREHHNYQRIVERMLEVLAPHGGDELEDEGLAQRLYPWPAPIFGVHNQAGQPSQAFCFDAEEYGLNPTNYHNVADEIAVEMPYDEAMRTLIERAARSHERRRRRPVGRTQPSVTLQPPGLSPGLIRDPSEITDSPGKLGESLFPLGARRQDFVEQCRELAALRNRLAALGAAAASSTVQRRAS